MEGRLPGKLAVILLALSLLPIHGCADSTDVYVIAPWEIIIGWTLDVPPHAVLTITLPDTATVKGIKDAGGDVKYEQDGASHKITIGEHPQILILYSMGYEEKPYISYGGAFPTDNVTVWVPEDITLVTINSEEQPVTKSGWTGYVAPSDVSFTAMLKEARYTLSQTVTVKGDNTNDLTLHVLVAQETRNQEVLSTEPEGITTDIGGLEYAKIEMNEVTGTKVHSITQDILVRTSDDLVDHSRDNGTKPDSTFWTVTPAMDLRLKEISDPKKVFDWVAGNIEYIKMQDRMGSDWAYTNRKGDCNEFTDLYLAFTRAQGVPGLSMSGITGDTGHAWAASYLNGKWRGVDATWDIFGYSPASHVILSYSTESAVSNIKLSFYGDRPEIVHDYTLMYNKGTPLTTGIDGLPIADLERGEPASSGAERVVPVDTPIEVTDTPSLKEEVPSPALDEPHQAQRIEPGKAVGKSFTKQSVEAAYDFGKDEGVTLTSEGLSLSTTEAAVAGGAVGGFILIMLIVVFKR